MNIPRRTKNGDGPGRPGVTLTPFAYPITVKTMTIFGNGATSTGAGHVTLTLAGTEVRVWTARWPRSLCEGS